MENRFAVEDKVLLVAFRFGEARTAEAFDRSNSLPGPCHVLFFECGAWQGSADFPEATEFLLVARDWPVNPGPAWPFELTSHLACQDGLPLCGDTRKTALCGGWLREDAEGRRRICFCAPFPELDESGLPLDPVEIAWKKFPAAFAATNSESSKVHARLCIHAGRNLPEELRARLCRLLNAVEDSSVCPPW